MRGSLQANAFNSTGIQRRLAIWLFIIIVWPTTMVTSPQLSSTDWSRDHTGNAKTCFDFV